MLHKIYPNRLTCHLLKQRPFAHENCSAAAPPRHVTLSLAAHSFTPSRERRLNDSDLNALGDLH